MSIYKVLKDFPSRNGVKQYKAGENITLNSNSRTKALIEMGYIKPENMSKSVFKQWDDEGFISKYANLIVAPEDYYESKKKHFTFDEAMAIEKKLNNGWRLPTRSEWVLLLEEFGQNSKGLLNREILMKNLKLQYTGYVGYGSPSDSTSEGYWWSSTAYNATHAYNLYIHSRVVGPGTNVSARYSGFAVRLVKDI